MTLKVIKGKKTGSNVSDKGLFIIEATNNKEEVGYIAEVGGKISVSQKLIPQVVRYTSYKEAKHQVNHIESNVKGLKLKILSQKSIEEILSSDQNLDVVIPIKEVKESYIVGVFDNTSLETIGYLCYNPDNKSYFMKKSKDGVAFWDSKENVDKFIEGGTRLIASYPNLKLTAILLK
jgi:hypothetical protein